MRRVGNIPLLEQARAQLLQAEIAIAHGAAKQAAWLARQRLGLLLGLEGGFSLPDTLPKSAPATTFAAGTVKVFVANVPNEPVLPVTALLASVQLIAVMA
jgi:hypothetical protein